MNGDYLINTVPEDVSGGEIGWDTTDVKPAVPGWFLRNDFLEHPSIIILLWNGVGAAIDGDLRI